MIVVHNNKYTLTSTYHVFLLSHENTEKIYVFIIVRNCLVILCYFDNLQEQLLWGYWAKIILFINSSIMVA